MFEVLLDHFLRDVAGAPSTVAYRPEVLPPVLLPQLWGLLLEAARSPPLEDAHILGVADVDDQILASGVDVVPDVRGSKPLNVRSLRQCGRTITTTPQTCRGRAHAGNDTKFLMLSVFH
jgi:hypothetical protein